MPPVWLMLSLSLADATHIIPQANAILRWCIRPVHSEIVSWNATLLISTSSSSVPVRRVSRLRAAWGNSRQARGRNSTSASWRRRRKWGGHIVSGAVVEPRALDELFPDWREQGAPLRTPVERDAFYWLANARRGLAVPRPLIPRVMHNRGNCIASLGRLCKWLAEQAENMGCHLFTGFAAVEVLYDDQGSVVGVATGDMGVAADGAEKTGYQAGYELRAPYVIFAEGCRGSLGKCARGPLWTKGAGRPATLRDRLQGSLEHRPGKTRARHGGAYVRLAAGQSHRGRGLSLSRRGQPGLSSDS